jgi:hypothetical protein
MAAGNGERLSPERAADLARMMKLPDAADVSAEQLGYRRKVAADLEAVSPEKEETHAA